MPSALSHARYVTFLQRRFPDLPLPSTVNEEGVRSMINAGLARGLPVLALGKPEPHFPACASLLHMAAHEGDVDLATHIVGRQAVIKVDRAWRGGPTPLEVACMRWPVPPCDTKAAVVRLLLGHGAQADPGGRSSLGLAWRALRQEAPGHQQAGVMKREYFFNLAALLLEAGADPNGHMGEIPVLHAALQWLPRAGPTSAKIPVLHAALQYHLHDPPLVLRFVSLLTRFNVDWARRDGVGRLPLDEVHPITQKAALDNGWTARAKAHELRHALDLQVAVPDGRPDEGRVARRRL